MNCVGARASPFVARVQYTGFAARRFNSFECELISARTGEGRECAKARGVKMGRKPKLTPHQIREAIKRRDTKSEQVREIARTFNVSHSTIFTA
jgi:DNA invertase Pin-like site-specific DNA recombinase